MAKQAKTAIKTKDQKAAAEAKNWTKVIKAVRSPKTGAYTLKRPSVHKDKVKVSSLLKNNFMGSMIPESCLTFETAFLFNIVL
jgi:hypothetical protein